MKAPNVTKAKWTAHEFHTLELADAHKVSLGHQLSQEHGVFALFTDDGNGNGYPLPIENFGADAKMLAAAPMLAEALVGILAWNEGKLREYQMPPLLRDASRAALLSAGYTEE